MSGPVRRVLLLVNPVAGGGRALRNAPAVAAALEASGLPVDVITTLGMEHAEDVAAGASPDDIVAVLSGDGLMGRVAAGVARSGALLAPLPGGRGNDFAAVMGVPADPVAAAAARLAAARESRVDLGWAAGPAWAASIAGSRPAGSGPAGSGPAGSGPAGSGPAGSGPAAAAIPFLGVASAGLDAVAARIARDTRRPLGSLLYPYAAARALVTTAPRAVVLELDGRRREERAWLVAVGNSGRYGGGMRICPDARVDDGVLDVVTIGPVSRASFVPLLLSVFRGAHVRHPLVTYERARTVVVTAGAGSTGDLAAAADGEPLAGLPMTVTVDPGAVRVLA